LELSRLAEGVNRMRHSLHYARPLDYAPLPTRSWLRELLGWLASTAAVAVGGFCLLAMVVPRINNGRSDSGGPRAPSDVASLSKMLDAFAADTGRYPTDAEGLAALLSPPAGIAGWRGPYVQQLKNDPWGHPYVYHLGGPAGGGTGYRVASKGRDGKEGTANDIGGGSDSAAVRIVPPTMQRSEFEIRCPPPLREDARGSGKRRG
jgi:general secretion pathway protein G